MRILKGLSFPFRVGNKGGAVVTTADRLNPTHIIESLEQILNTHIGERVMNSFGSSVSSTIFEPNDTSTHTLLKYEIVEAIREWDERVEVTEEDIVLVESEDNRLVVDLNFLVVDLNKYFNATIEIGG